MPTINRDAFEHAIYDAGIELDFDDTGWIRPNYSGRCMYGDSCIGLVLDSDRDLLMLFTRLGERVYCEGMDELDFSPAEMAESMRSDSMGRSATIYYFPGWTFESDGQS